MNVSDFYNMVISKGETTMHVSGVAMIQTFSLKKSLNKFGTRGEKGVTKELNQLYYMQAYCTFDPKALTKEQ